MPTTDPRSDDLDCLLGGTSTTDAHEVDLGRIYLGSGHGASGEEIVRTVCETIASTHDDRPVRFPTDPSIHVDAGDYIARFSLDVYTSSLALNNLDAIPSALTEIGIAGTVEPSANLHSGDDLIDTWAFLAEHVPEDERADLPSPIQSLVSSLNGHPRDALDLRRVWISVDVNGFRSLQG
jgi:hypothetical protein